MKRHLSFLLFLFFIVSCLTLTGCGGSKKEDSSQPASSNQQTTNKENTQAAKDEPLSSLFTRGKKVEGVSFDYSMTSKDLVVNGKMWIEGEKFKTESTVEGKKVVSILNDNTSYLYYPDENTAMKVVLDKQNKQSENPFDYSKDIDTAPDKYKVLETTVYEGVKCKVVAVTSADGKDNLKMWVREDYGIPIRVEATEAGGGKVVIEYKNMKVGKQPADTFQLPPGVAVTDTSQMLKDLSKMPGAGNE